MRMKKNSKSERRVRIIGVKGEIDSKVSYSIFNYHVILILKNLLRIRKRKKSKERDKPKRGD